MMQTSHNAKPSHQISKANCRLALIVVSGFFKHLRDPTHCHPTYLATAETPFSLISTSSLSSL